MERGPEEEGQKVIEQKKEEQKAIRQDEKRAVLPLFLALGNVVLFMSVARERSR